MSIFKKNIINIAIINLNTFYTAYNLKKTYFFNFFVKNMKFQVVKKVASKIILIFKGYNL